MRRYVFRRPFDYGRRRKLSLVLYPVAGGAIAGAAAVPGQLPAVAADAEVLIAAAGQTPGQVPLAAGDATHAIAGAAAVPGQLPIVLAAAESSVAAAGQTPGQVPVAVAAGSVTARLASGAVPGQLPAVAADAEAAITATGQVPGQAPVVAGDAAHSITGAAAVPGQVPAVAASATVLDALLSTGADSLRIEVDAVEVVHLTAVGTIPGVVVNHAAAMNGPGAGVLRYDSDGLAWKPPGESEYGEAVVVTDGVYLLEGADADKFLRVTVHADYLVVGSEGRVFLADRYANGIDYDDVTAGEAAAGDVVGYQLGVANDSGGTVCNVLAWLDASAEGSAYLELSDDGVSWSSPTTEPTGVALGNIVAAGSATLYARRTIPAAEPFDPAVLTHLHFGFDNRS